VKAKEFKGIIPPLQTAFTEDGEIHEKGVRAMVRFTLPHVGAFYPVGTYGSGPLMSIDERKKALEIILDETAGKAPVIAHVGCADTKSAIELAKHAKKAGARAVGAISPYYSPNLPDDFLFGYFNDIMQAVNETEFPVFVYNNGHYSQNAVSPAVLKRLAKSGLRGCKDSSFDLVNYYYFRDAVAEYPDFNLIIGTEAIFVPAFETGARGCVCGIGNIFPEIMRKMYDEFMAGNVKASLETQDLILRIRSVIKQWPTLSILHAILEMRGVDAGFPRRPYLQCPPEMKARIRGQLRELRVI
jgi:dihydrodipicolinate synthase/N-acetylneuraminate lyase